MLGPDHSRPPKPHTWLDRGDCMFNLPFLGMSILYPRGRKALNPTMRSGCSWKSCDTRRMTPGVSMLERRRIRVGRTVWGAPGKRNLLPTRLTVPPNELLEGQQNTPQCDQCDSANVLCVIYFHGNQARAPCALLARTTGHLHGTAPPKHSEHTRARF